MEVLAMIGDQLFLPVRMDAADTHGADRCTPLDPFPRQQDAEAFYKVIIEMSSLCDTSHGIVLWIYKPGRYCELIFALTLS